MDPIFSSMADDPAMADLIAYFVGVLPARLGELRAARDAGDREGMRVIAHQLKGAAGGFGFEPISDAARALEQALAAGEDPAALLIAFEAIAARVQSQP